ncbi:MAG: hypothetical protein V1779_08465 [bacterium]
MKRKLFFLIAFLLAISGLERAKAQEPLPDTVWTYTSWPSQNFTSVLFSKDGTKIYTGGDSLKVFDTETGQSLKSINHGWITYLSLSKTGKYLASCTSTGVITVWDTETMEMYQRFNDFNGSYTKYNAFSPDEQLLAASSYNKGVKIWNIHTKELIDSFYNKMNPDSYNGACLEFTDDGKYLGISGYNNILRNYDLLKKEFTNFQISNVVRFKFFDNDKKILVYKDDEIPTMISYEISTYKKLHEFKGHSDGVIWGMKITPDSKYLISAGDDYTVRIWDIETGVNTYTYNYLGPKMSVDYTTDLKYIASCSPGHLILFNAKWTGTGVEEPDNPIEIISNISSFPNPGIDSMTLEYTVNQFINLKIDIFDLIGNKIQNLFDGFKEPGIYNIDMYTGSIPSGIYHIRFSAGEFISTIDIVVNN